MYICKRNEVNWAKNDRARAVFVDEVKIRENSRISRNRDFRHFGWNFDSTVRAQFWGDWPHFFFCCLIIAYILGSYHDLTWKSDFWVDLRGEDDCAPPAVNFVKKEPRQVGLTSLLCSYNRYSRQFRYKSWELVENTSFSTKSQCTALFIVRDIHKLVNHFCMELRFPENAAFLPDKVGCVSRNNYSKTITLE